MLGTGEEVLLVHIPRKSERWEIAPTVILRETAGLVSTEGGSGVVAVEQGVVHTGDERIECAFADARLRGVDIGTITQVVLLQRLVREVVGTDAAMGRCARLLGVTSQSVNLMDAQFLLIG